MTNFVVELNLPIQKELINKYNSKYFFVVIVYVKSSLASYD